MSELDVLGVLNGTGKSSNVSHAWDYLCHCEGLFSKWRHSDINLIEIGVLGGSSLETWFNYFDKTTLVGIDINPECRRLARDRVVIRIGSQEDPGFLHGVATAYPPAIIIDDGSHLTHHMIASFEALFPTLLPGGIYIFEDLSFHFPDGVGQWKGAEAHQGLSDTSIYDYLNRFMRARAANVSIPEGSWGFDRYAFEQIDSITIFGGAVAVHKRATQDAERMVTLFEAHIEKSPTNGIFKERYAEYLARKGLYLERALDLVRQALAANPNGHSALALQTMLLMRLRRFQEASESANKLVALDQGQVVPWLHLADVERARSRPDLELAALQRAVELDPRPPAFDRIGSLQEHFGDLPAALAAARRASELQPNDAALRQRVSGLVQRL